MRGRLRLYCNPMKNNIGTFKIKGVTFEMVKVDGGSYQMGSYAGASDEQPVHTETVNTFYIGKTLVTQRLWSAVMGDNPSHFSGDNRPVENVSWLDCQEFVDRLGRLTGHVFRLPTEVEWEYAARGGNRSRGHIYSGSDDVDRVAWYNGNSGGTTYPVGQKLDNELGIYDMSGNVWEWCSDKYGDNYSCPRDSSDFVFRGGSFSYLDFFCKVSIRNFGTSRTRSSDLGFRLALNDL
ncbi:MAG: formylglycine-generating enzyme family protein [Muribaculaceae bacterium]|nr:formylglycine-generating enzyme family protein [Muribaculaceae bacterium]